MGKKIDPETLPCSRCRKPIRSGSGCYLLAVGTADIVQDGIEWIGGITGDELLCIECGRQLRAFRDAGVPTPDDLFTTEEREMARGIWEKAMRCIPLASMTDGEEGAADDDR